MAPKPTVDLSRIKELYLLGLSQREIAERLTEELGRKVSKALVSKAIQRQGWTAKNPPNAAAMDYAWERALGPIKPAHRGARAAADMAAYERVEAGLLSPTSVTGNRAQGFVARKLHLRMVACYDRSSGFYERPAFPWEEYAKAYFAQPVPEYADLEIERGLAEPPEWATSAHLQYWEGWLALYRVASERAER